MMLGVRKFTSMCMCACIAVGTLCLQGVAKELHMLLRASGVALVGRPSEIELTHINLPQDAKVCVFFSMVFFMANWCFRWLLVEPFAYRVVDLRKDKLIKFSQSVTEAVIYGAFSAMGLRIVISQEFVWPSAQWWMGIKDGTRFLMRADLRCFYIMYMARYCQAAVSVLLEPKRKDFIEMMIHHIVTVIVIFASYVYGWSRIGAVVMLLLDPADVPLHLAKLCKYTSEATGQQMWQFVANRLFELFAVVFFLSRLMGFGYVCWSAHVETNRYISKGPREWACLTLLSTLFALQCYWFLLIIQVAVKMMRGGNSDDPRSDDESEVQEGKKDE